MSAVRDKNIYLVGTTSGCYSDTAIFVWSINVIFALTARLDTERLERMAWPGKKIKHGSWSRTLAKPRGSGAVVIS